MAGGEKDRRVGFRRAASPDGVDGSLTIYQDARLYLASLSPGEGVAHEIEPGRAAWLQVLRGTMNALRHALAAGDGAAVTADSAASLQPPVPSALLCFALA